MSPRHTPASPSIGDVSKPIKKPRTSEPLVSGLDALATETVATPEHGMRAVRVLAIDAALRKTGIALLDGPATRLFTMHYKGPREGLFLRAKLFLSDHLTGCCANQTVVEYPPEAIRKGKRYVGAELGFASASWCSAAFDFGFHPDRPPVAVPVGVWRESILGKKLGGSENAKRLAVIRANDYLARHGLAPVEDDHQAEALCLAEHWMLTHAS